MFLAALRLVAKWPQFTQFFLNVFACKYPFSNIFGLLTYFTIV